MSTQEPTTSVEYRQIERFVGYRFGSDGSAWTEWRKGPNSIRTGRWKRLKPFVKIGYLYVGLKDIQDTRTKHDKLPHYRLHRLILEAFVGPCPEGMGCRHLNGNKMDNRIENLAWGTQQENIDDNVVQGTIRKRESHGMAKLTGEQVERIRIARARGATLNEIGTEFGIGLSQVSRIIHNKSWSRQM